MAAAPLPYRACRDGLLLSVQTTPKASRDELEGLRRGADGAVSLAVRVRAQPQHGAANQAVIATLAKAFGLPKSALRVTAGHGHRHKTVQIAGSPAALRAAVEQVLDTLAENARA